MTYICSFAEALSDSGQFSKRHLLLGNGFSIACCPGIFHYGSLFAKADFSGHPNLIRVFEALDTKDFEVAIRNLESGARLLPIYASAATGAAARMRADATALKKILLSTIAKNHPNIPAEIPDEKFWACRRFLESFLGCGVNGHVFTLNYDLLLYWALLHEDMPFNDPIGLSINDGFGNDEDDPEADYVVWQDEISAHSARVHFLHGALHLFDAGNDLQKIRLAPNERATDRPGPHGDQRQ